MWFVWKHRNSLKVFKNSKEQNSTCHHMSRPSFHAVASLFIAKSLSYVKHTPADDMQHSINEQEKFTKQWNEVLKIHPDVSYNVQFPSNTKLGPKLWSSWTALTYSVATIWCTCQCIIDDVLKVDNLGSSFHCTASQDNIRLAVKNTLIQRLRRETSKDDLHSKTPS
jgi:hypothetical protein